MIRSAKARTLNPESLPDAVRIFRHFSQAEAQLLGSVNYCFFPASLVQSPKATGNDDTQQESSDRLTRVPR
jgi:hypothetical protein